MAFEFIGTLSTITAFDDVSIQNSCTMNDIYMHTDLHVYSNILGLKN